jgi:hypothetical protein
MRDDVELHIDSLVLHGFDPRDQAAVGRALRTELTRLIADGGLPAGLASADGASRMDGGAFRASPGQRPAEVGAAVARSIYASTPR